MRIEQKILTNLVYNEEYCRKVLPFIKAEYFAARPDRVVVEEIVKFFGKFNKPATKDILKIEIGNRTDLSEDKCEARQKGPGFIAIHARIGVRTTRPIELSGKLIDRSGV